MNETKSIREQRDHRFSALLSVHPYGAGEAGGNWNRDHREEPEPEGWKEQRTEDRTEGKSDGTPR